MPKKDHDDDDSQEGSSKSRPYTAYDVQKVRLDKLFNNIDKPIEIPERKEERKFANAPEFVRNVMGSSAGAGSGEFHVYRHLRRKEYARLHFIETQARNEQLDNDFRQKLEDNRKRAEEATEKKRAKRQKKKEKQKLRKKMKKEGGAQDHNDDNNSSDDGEEDQGEDRDNGKDEPKENASEETEKPKSLLEKVTADFE